MAVDVEDIEYRLSVPSASAGDSDAQGDTNASLGGYMSTTELSSGQVGNLFDTLSGDDNQNEVEHYRCLFVTNTNATDDWVNVTVWIAEEVAGGADAEIGLDPAGVVASDSSTDQAETVVDDTTAPSGVSFSAPSTSGTAIEIPGGGTIGAGECIAIWVKRIATDSGPIAEDGITIRTTGETAE